MYSIRISAVALLAAVTLATPSLSASLGLLDKGSAVKVDLNSNDGVKANVNLGDTQVKANVDAGDVLGNKDGNNTPVSVSVGNSGGGSTPATVTVKGSPLDSGGGSTKVNVNTGTLLPDATGGLVDDNTTDATVTLGGSGSNLVDDLFGGTTSANANVKIGNTIPLGGTPVGGPSTANVALNASPLSGDPLAGVGDVANVVADVNLLEDLFGGTIGIGVGGGGTGGGGTGGGSMGGNGGGTGGNGGGTGGNGGGTGGNGGGIGGNGGGIGGGSGGLVASVDGSVGASCFAPTSAQANTLINRHAYGKSELAAYAKAKNVQFVRISLCASARAKLSAKAAADAGVKNLQRLFARSAMIAGALSSSGKTARDVVGSDLRGTTLVVYVI